MFEKSSTWILIPINKRMGYDVDRRPRTNRNKETSPIEPTSRKEQERKKEKAHPARAHTRTHKSHRGIKGGLTSRVLLRPLPSARQSAPAPRKGTSHGSMLRMLKDSSAARLAGSVGPVSQEHSWALSPTEDKCDGPAHSSSWIDDDDCPTTGESGRDLGPGAHCWVGAGCTDLRRQVKEVDVGLDLDLGPASSARWRV